MYIFGIQNFVILILLVSQIFKFFRFSNFLDFQTFQVVALGVVPFLLPGVGLPADKRSKFLQYLLITGKELPSTEVMNALYFDLNKIQSRSEYSNHLNTEHPKSKHSTFGTFFVRFLSGLIKRPFKYWTFQPQNIFLSSSQTTICKQDMFGPLQYQTCQVFRWLVYRTGGKSNDY